jgi:hypothetical protein
MSLSLVKSLSSGVSVSYWVISSANLSTASQTATIAVNGYITQPAYQAGLDPVITYSVTLTLNPTLVYNNTTFLQALYVAVGANSYFTGASYNSDGV